MGARWSLRPRERRLPARVAPAPARSRSRTSRSFGSSWANTVSTSNRQRTAMCRPSRCTINGMLATPPVALQTASSVTATEARVSGRPLPCSCRLASNSTSGGERNAAGLARGRTNRRGSRPARTRPSLRDVQLDPVEHDPVRLVGDGPLERRPPVAEERPVVVAWAFSKAASLIFSTSSGRGSLDEAVGEGLGVAERREEAVDTVRDLLARPVLDVIADDRAAVAHALQLGQREPSNRWSSGNRSRSAACPAAWGSWPRRITACPTPSVVDLLLESGARLPSP